MCSEIPVRGDTVATPIVSFRAYMECYGCPIRFPFSSIMTSVRLECTCHIWRRLGNLVIAIGGSLGLTHAFKS